MNSIGTPPMVQKNSSTPGTPVSNRDIIGERHRLVVGAAEVVGQERQRREPLGSDVTQVLGNIEHLDQTGVAAAEHRHVGAVGRRPAQRRLQHLAGNPHLELNFHSDDIRQEADEGFGRMAAHDDVVQLL